MNSNALTPGSLLRSPGKTYRIEAMLGSGGFGITYLATFKTIVNNIPSRVSVAIKEHFPAADCMRDPASQNLTCTLTARERVGNSLREFISEARNLTRLAGVHPNIVSVNEVFEANGTAYYVMEYIEGQNLRDYVEANGPLSPSQTLSIMMPVIEAVKTIHALHFTHLDIKPANIMLAVDDTTGLLRPILIDFGLAKHYDNTGNATTTLESSGYSDGYAPAEQYAGITTFSPSVDVYALAATILFCLAGQKPPKATELTPDAIQSMLSASVPPALRQTLVRALSYHPAQRFPDASGLFEALAAVNIQDSPAETVGPQPVSGPQPLNDYRTRFSGDNTRLSGPQPPVSNPDPTVVLQTAPNPYQNQVTEPEYEPKENNSSNLIKWIALAALIAILVFVSLMAWDKYKEKQSRDRDDDIPTVPATVESVAEKTKSGTPKPLERKASSGRLSNGEATPDLSFHELSGPVSSCKNHWGEVLRFDRDGNWTSNYHDNLGPRTFYRDSDGRITDESYSSSSAGSGNIHYNWSGNRKASMSDENRGQYTSFEYYDNGDVSRQVSRVVNGSTDKTSVFDYSNYVHDAHGNWIRRSFTVTTDDGYNRTTKSGTNTRKITYY